MRDGPICPFCRYQMYECVDIGVGYAPVAVNCCDAGYDLHRGKVIASRILRLRRSHSPRKKARAKQLMELHYS